MPSVNSWVPEKIEIMDAKKGNPGTLPCVMTDWNGTEASRSPGEQHIDRYVGTVELRERIAQTRAENAKSADLLRDFQAHRDAEGPFDQRRSQAPTQTIMLFQRRAVHDVVPFIQTVEQFGDFFWRVLQVIIQRDDDFVFRQTYAA